MSIIKQTIVTLSLSPIRLQIDIAYNVLLCLHVPYTSEMVTLMINPDITAYYINVKKDLDKWEILPSMNYKETSETRLVSLNIKDSLPQKVSLNNVIYELKLVRVYNVRFQENDFPTFDIIVSPLIDRSFVSK